MYNYNFSINAIEIYLEHTQNILVLEIRRIKLII